MEHVKANSSSVESHGYDPATRTLEVKFKGSGKTYSYAGVPYDTHLRLTTAKSVGKFVHKNIIPNYQGKHVR